MPTFPADLTYSIEERISFKDNELNNSPVLKISGDHIDFDCLEKENGSCVDQLRWVTSSVWEKRRFFFPKLDSIKTYQLNTLDLFNLGNDDESYSLQLTQSTWKLQAYLSTDETPVLDAWDGETTIALNLPMPVGLSPGLYTASITATSVDDPTVSKSITINIDVEDTSAVSVSDEDADQSFLPGGLPQSMRFEVRNDGNQDDRFDMSLDLPDGMYAQFEQLVDGNMTPSLEPGESYNLTVKFWFDENTSGQLIMRVVATSVNDATVSSSGMTTSRNRRRHGVARSFI